MSFKGSYVALVTPFKPSMEIDFEAYGRLVDYQLEKGTDGLVPCGTTGEAPTLSHDEQKQCIRFVIERVAGRVPVLAGTGSNNTAEAVGLTRFAKEAGADGALLITPYYNKPTTAGQIAHYQAVASAVDIPIMLYNVPGRTGTKMEPSTIAALSKTPNIVAVKEACGSVDQVTQILSRCDITVISGDDSLTLPMMAVGATGVISVAANVAPAETAALCRMANTGDWDGARKMHYKLAALFTGLFVESNPIPVKAALARMGIMDNVLRLPLVPMTESLQPQIDAILKDLALI
jgi:4-hydroxy-tetrahydrodipicolinate synthase